MSRFKPTPTYRLFLNRLVEARTERGISIPELADRLALPIAEVAAFENGEKPLDFVQTHAWCRALGVPFTEFVLKVGEDIEALLSQNEGEVT